MLIKINLGMLQRLKNIRRIYLNILILFVILLAACQKRAQCPAYWDSDPKIIFGDETLLDRQKDMEKAMQKGKKNRKGSFLGLGKQRKSSYKKQKPSKRLKRNKRKVKKEK